jgi:hypothetical protein
MKRLSRHTVVVIVVALLACVGGMALSVVAFGQAGGDPDATVPLGDYTATTPTTTTPLSGYTTTTPTNPATTPVTTTPAETTPTSGQSTTGTSNPTSSSGPSSTTGHQPVPSSSPSVPSRVTRRGPTRLAFTGGEPLIIGGAGLAVMLAGLTLQARRRRPHAG